MELRVLAVGDVVGTPGLNYLTRELRHLRRTYGVDFCIVNGENASMTGITPRQAEEILDAGADVITLGNHTWNRREICTYLEDTDRVLRPANFAPQLPGTGVGRYETSKGEVAVIDLIGRCELDSNADNPFYKADSLLKDLKGLPVLVEFHGEATSEKLAMGFYLDGRAAAVWGTHSHVPTADLRILPKGTGFVTDLGMTGPMDSVLGVRPEQSIALFRGELTSRFEAAPGPCWLCGALFTIDTAAGRCVAVEQILLREGKV